MCGLCVVQSQMKVMAAELVARAGEVDRLRTDFQTAQAESKNLRSELAQLSQRAEETQKKLDSEVNLLVRRFVSMTTQWSVGTVISLGWVRNIVTINKSNSNNSQYHIVTVVFHCRKHITIDGNGDSVKNSNSN